MTPFLIFSLPRSRTFWLSRFLNYGGWTCAHDEIRHCRSLDDVRAWFSLPFTGSVETAAAPFWRLALKLRPDLKTVVIRRPVDEVMDSYRRSGVAYDFPALRREMRRLDAKLDQIEARVSGVLSVQCRDLDTACDMISTHCTGRKPDKKWREFNVGLKLKIDLLAMVRYYQAYAPQLTRLAQQAKQAMLADLIRRPVSSDAITFQQEPFDIFLADGERLFAEHLVQVGESPDAHARKNLDLMRYLAAAGVLHVTTARCNGRMLGYLMALIAPSLEDAAKREALHTTFFTSQDAPGLGLKLQRASVNFLRSLGVDDVILRAGVRGAGPKLGALYRRMGAEDFGQMFRLGLKDVA